MSLRMLTLEFATPADLALCRQMIRQGSKSFHLASLLLPNIYRQHARALYGFCRMADDLVDHADHPKLAVDELARRLDLIYLGKPEDNPTDRAFADVAHRFGIPRAVPDALIEGFAWDAEGKHYQTLSDVKAYSVRVAGTVGVMMSLLMGQRHPDALARAIDLGVAMQFSNIARDVEEDAKLGRVYLPEAWLGEKQATSQLVLQQPLTGAAVASRLVREAEIIYSRAAAGIALLPRSCRASINAARLLYREIGIEAERIQHKGRAVVSLRRKLMLVAKAVVQAAWLPREASDICLAEGQFLLDAVATTPPPAAAPQGIAGQMDWVMKMFIAVESRRR
jgi:15-cis-phytoene synthase